MNVWAFEAARQKLSGRRGAVGRAESEILGYVFVDGVAGQWVHGESARDRGG